MDEALFPLGLRASFFLVRFFWGFTIGSLRKLRTIIKPKKTKYYATKTMKLRKFFGA